MARDHRKLDAFKLADELAIKIYRSTDKFPVAERFGLQSQLRRAGVSAPTNIVEGCARDSEIEYLRFLEIAFSSCREGIYVSDLSMRLTFLDPLAARELDHLGGRTAAAFAALRKGIRGA